MEPKVKDYHYYLLVFVLIALASQVSSQWLSRRVSPRVPGRGFHMARPRMRPALPPPGPGRMGHPYFRGPNMLPHPSLLNPPTHTPTTTNPIPTLSPNSSALNYIEITADQSAAISTDNSNSNSNNTNNGTVTNDDPSASTASSPIITTDLPSPSSLVSGSVNDAASTVDVAATSPTPPNPNDPNTIFSDRMIEILKKLGELAAEENSTTPSTKTDRQFEIVQSIDATGIPADEKKTEPEIDYSTLFGGLPQEKKQAELEPPPPPPASLPPPQFPPPPHSFHSNHRRVPPPRPHRGPPPHRPLPPPPQPPPPPPPGAGHFGAPPKNGRHPHRKPHPKGHLHPHPPPAPTSMWNSLRGMFSRKRPPTDGIPPHLHHHPNPNPTKATEKNDGGKKKEEDQEPDPANPARRLDDNIAEDLNAATEDKNDKDKTTEKPKPPEVKVSDFSLEFTKDSPFPERRSHPPPPPPKITSRSDEISSSAYSNLKNANSNTMNTLARLSPKKPIMVFMRAEGIYEIHRTGADAGKIVKKYAGSTKIQFFNGTIPWDNIPPVFLAPEDSDAPIGYGKIPIPKISSRSSSEEILKPKPTYLSIPEQLELLRKQRDRLKLLKQEQELKKLDESKQATYYKPKDTPTNTEVQFLGFGGDSHTHSVTKYTDNAFVNPTPSLTADHLHIPGTGVSASEGFEIELPSGSDSNGLISNSELQKIVAGLIGGGAPPKITQALSTSGIHGLKPPALQAQAQGQSHHEPHGHGAPINSNPFNRQFRPPPTLSPQGPGSRNNPPGHFPPAPLGSHESLPHGNRHDPFSQPGPDFPGTDRPPFYDGPGAGIDHGHRQDQGPDDPPPKDGVSVNLSFYIKKEKPRRPPPPPPGYHGHDSLGSHSQSKPHYGPPPSIQATPTPQFIAPPPFKSHSSTSKLVHAPPPPIYQPPGQGQSQERGSVPGQGKFRSSEEQHRHQHHHSASNQHSNILPPPSSNLPGRNQLTKQNNHQHLNSQNLHPQHPSNNLRPNSSPQFSNEQTYHPPPVNSNPPFPPQTRINSLNVNGHHHHNTNTTHNSHRFPQQPQTPAMSGEYRPYVHPAPILPRPSTTSNEIYVTESKDQRPPGFRPFKAGAKSKPLSNPTSIPPTMTYFGYESGVEHEKQSTRFNSIEKVKNVATATSSFTTRLPSHYSRSKTRNRYSHNQSGLQGSYSVEDSSQIRSQGQSQASEEMIIVHSSKNSKRRKNQQDSKSSKNPTVIIAGNGQNLSHLDKIINSLHLNKYHDKTEDTDQESEEVAHVHHYPLPLSSSSSSIERLHGSGHKKASSKSKPKFGSHERLFPQSSSVEAAIVQNLNGLFVQQAQAETQANAQAQAQTQAQAQPQAVVIPQASSSSVERGQGSSEGASVISMQSAKPTVEFSFGEIAEIMQQSQVDAIQQQQQQLQQQQQQQQHQLPQFLIQPPNFVQPQIVIQQQPQVPQIILQPQLPATGGGAVQPQILFHNGQNLFQSLPEQQLPLVISSLPNQPQLIAPNASQTGALPQVIFFPPTGPGLNQPIQPQPQPQPPLQLPQITFNPPQHLISSGPAPALSPFGPFPTAQPQQQPQQPQQQPSHHHPVVTRLAPAASQSTEFFSHLPVPHQDNLEPVLEKVRKEEKIVWKQLPAEGAQPARMVPLRITTEEKQYIHPNGRTEVESTVVDTSIAEEYLNQNPVVQSAEFFKRSSESTDAKDNAKAEDVPIERAKSVPTELSHRHEHPKSVFTGLLQAKAEMEKMKQDMKSPFEKLRGRTESSIFG